MTTDYRVTSSTPPNVPPVPTDWSDNDNYNYDPAWMDLYATDETSSPAPAAAPIDPETIARTARAELTPTQLRDLRNRGVQYRVLEVWFKPTATMTRERVMRDFGITDPALVHELPPTGHSKLLVEFPPESSYQPLDYAPLAAPGDPAGELEAAKQRLLLDFTDLSGLRNGYLQVRFTTDDETNEIENYIVYWISNVPGEGVEPRILSSRIDGRTYFDETLPDAQRLFAILQELLQLTGYLPENQEVTGGPDDRTIENSFNYLLSNRELLQPGRREEAEAQMNSQWDRFQTLLQRYFAVRDNANLIVPANAADAQQFKQQMLAGLVREMLDILSNVRLQAQNNINTFTGPEHAEFRQACQEKLDYIESKIQLVIDKIIGTGEQDGYLQTVDLPTAQNKVLAYLETIKEWEKAINQHKPAEEIDELRVRAGNLRREAIDAYRQMYELLHYYEKSFDWLPGVKERCQALRAQILAGLDAAGSVTRFEEKISDRNPEDPAYHASDAVRQKAGGIIDDIAASLTALGSRYGTEQEYVSERAQGLYQYSGDLTTSVAPDETDPEKIRLTFEKAAYISSQLLTDESTRGVMISFFQDVLKGEDRVSVNSVFQKFNKMLTSSDPRKHFSEEDLVKLARYFLIWSMYAEQGLSSADIEKKMKPMRQSIQPLLKRFEDLFKPAPGQETPERCLEASRLQSAVQSLIRVAYRRMVTYNSWAQAQGKPPLNFTYFNQLGQQVVAALPPTREEAKKVFKYLSEASEDPALAAYDLQNKLQEDLVKAARQGAGSPFASRLDAQRFFQEAQTLTLDPRFFSRLSQDAGRALQFSHSDDLMWFVNRLPDGEFKQLSLHNLQEAVRAGGAGYYYYIEADNGIIFEKAPAPDQATLAERNVGGEWEDIKIGEFSYDIRWGSAFINTALAGRTQASFPLHTRTGETVNALDYNAVSGLITVAQQGKYSIRDGLSLNEHQRAVLNTVLDRPGNGLTDVQTARIKRLLRQGETFVDWEVPVMRELCRQLAELDVSYLSAKSRLVFLDAAGELREAVEIRFERKEGLNEDDYSALMNLESQMQRYGILITDLTADNPTEEMLAKITSENDTLTLAARQNFTEIFRAAMPILRVIHFQLRMLATQYAPNEEIPTEWMDRYIKFWEGVPDIIKETIAPTPIQSFQIAGLPPSQILEIKAILYPEKMAQVYQDIVLMQAFQQAQTGGSAALNTLNADQKLAMRKLFSLDENNPISEAELRQIFDSIPTTRTMLAEFSTTLSGLQPLKERIRSEFIDPLERELERLQIENRRASHRWNDPDALISPDQADDLQASGRANGRKAELLQEKLARLREVESALGNLQDLMSRANGDPIQLLAAFDQVNELLGSLQARESTGLFNLDGSEAGKALGTDILNRIKLAAAAIPGILDVRGNLFRWAEGKQKLEMERQELTFTFTSDRFTAADWELLKTRMPGLLGAEGAQAGWREEVTAFFEEVLLQRNGLIYGLGDEPVSAIEALDNYFAAGNEISLTSTTPVPGEPIEVTYAKVALTKIFERMPATGRFNAAMPALMTVFGGSGGVGGLFNLGRDALAVSGRATDWDQVNFGATDADGKLAILNDPEEQLQNIFLQSISFTANTVTPDMPLIPQFHQLMLYSTRRGAQYLESKVKDAVEKFGGDLSQTLSVMTQGDITAFKAYLNNEVIPVIFSNPEVITALRYQIEHHFVKSEFLKKILADADAYWAAPADQRRIPQYDLGTLLGLPGGELTELYDTFNEENHPALAALLQDLFIFSPELNKSNMVEDFEKQALTSVDVANQMVRARIPHQDMTQTPETVRVVSLDTDAQPGEVTEASWTAPYERAAEDTLTWADRTVDNFSGDVREAFQDRDTALAFCLRQAGGFAEGLGRGFVEMTWNMPRSIGTGFGNIWGGIADYMNAATEEQKNEALDRILSGLRDTAASFATFEGFPVIFLFGLKKSLDEGDWGGALAQAIFITKMFGSGLTNMGQGVRWAALNAKIAAWDQGLRRGISGIIRYGESIRPTATEAERLRRFVDQRNEGRRVSKYSFDARTGRIKVRGQMTLADKFALLDVFKNNPEACARIEVLYQRTRMPFIPVEANHYFNSFVHGTGVRILSTAFPIVPITRQMYLEGRHLARYGESRAIRQLGNRFRRLRLTLEPSVSIYAGEQSGARITDGRAMQAGRWLNLILDPRRYMFTTWDSLKGFVASAAGRLPRELASLPRVVREWLSSAMSSSPEAQTKASLIRIAADPNGSTTLNLYRGREETIQLERELRAAGTEVENKLRQEIAKANPDQTRIQELGAQLEDIQRRMADVTAEINQNTVKVRIKNSRLMRMLQSESGTANFFRYLGNLYDYRGSLMELRQQVAELRQVYQQNKVEINAAAAEIREHLPQTLDGEQLLKEIANPRRGVGGAARQYPFNLGEGRTIFLRGDQIARITNAVLKGKPLDFVAAFGITPEEARIVGTTIRDSFGRRMRTMDVLLTKALRIGVAAEPPHVINVADFAGQEGVRTVNGKTVIPFERIAAADPAFRLMLDTVQLQTGKRPTGYVVAEGRTVRFNDQLFKNEQRGRAQILFGDQGGRAEFLNPDPEKTKAPDAALQDPAGFDNYLSELRHRHNPLDLLAEQLPAEEQGRLSEARELAKGLGATDTQTVELFRLLNELKKNPAAAALGISEPGKLLEYLKNDPVGKAFMEGHPEFAPILAELEMLENIRNNPAEQASYSQAKELGKALGAGDGAVIGLYKLISKLRAQVPAAAGVDFSKPGALAEFLNTEQGKTFVKDNPEFINAAAALNAAEYSKAMADLGDTLGVDLERVNLDRLSRRFNEAINKAGLGTFFNNPEELVRMYEKVSREGVQLTEQERAFKQFLDTNPEIREQARRLQGTARGSIERLQLGRDIVSGLAVWLVAEGQLAFTDDPELKAALMLPLLHVDSVVMRGLTLTRLQKVYTMVRLAIQNTSAFGYFMEAQFGTQSLMRAAAQSGWQGLKSIFSPKSLVEGGKGFIGGLGRFYLLSKFLTEAGIENPWISTPLAIIGDTTLAWLLGPQMGMAVNAFGLAMWAGDNILHPIFDPIFYDSEYEADVAARVRQLDPWAANPAAELEVRWDDMAMATDSWLSVVHDLRGLLFSFSAEEMNFQDANFLTGVEVSDFTASADRLMAMLREEQRVPRIIGNNGGCDPNSGMCYNDPVYDGNEQAALNYLKSNHDDDGEEMVRKLREQFHLPDPEQFLLRVRVMNIQKTIRDICQMNTEGLGSSLVAKALEDAKELFHENGVLKDAVAEADLVRYLLTIDMSYRSLLGGDGTSQSEVPLAGGSATMTMYAPEEIGEGPSNSNLLDIRKKLRLAQIFAAMGRRETVTPTPADIAAGFFAADGKFNADNTLARAMVLGSYNHDLGAVQTAVVNHEVTPSVREQIFSVARQQLYIMQLKLNYLSDTDKANAELQLRLRGVAIEPQRWEQEKAAMMSVMTAFTAVENSTDPDEIAAALRIGHNVSGLQAFYGALLPMLTGTEKLLFQALALGNSQSEVMDYLFIVAKLGASHTEIGSLIDHLYRNGRISTEENFETRARVRILQVLTSPTASQEDKIGALKLAAHFGSGDMALQLFGMMSPGTPELNEEIKLAIARMIMSESEIMSRLLDQLEASGSVPDKDFLYQSASAIFEELRIMDYSELREKIDSYINAVKQDDFGFWNLVDRELSNSNNISGLQTNLRNAYRLREVSEGRRRAVDEMITEHESHGPYSRLESAFDRFNALRGADVSGPAVYSG